MNFLKKPFARDTTPHEAGELLRRFGLIALGAAPALLVIGGWRRSAPLLVVGTVTLAAGLAITLLSRKNQTAPADEPRQDSAPTAVPPPTAVPSLTATQIAHAASAPTSAAPSASRPRLVLLNASLAGPEGNSARLLARMATRLAPHAEIVHASLAGPEAATFASLAPTLRAADGFVFATGTHWDGWSSPLQKFLEDATPSEVTALWLGKPAAVVVSEHSTGGKGVLSRLQGVLVTFGCLIPPLSGLVLAKSAQTAGRAAPAEAEDFWCAEDLDVVADNLLQAARAPRPAWRAWPVDRENFSRRWVE
jgi:chromate reductase